MTEGAGKGEGERERGGTGRALTGLSLCCRSIIDIVIGVVVRTLYKSKHTLYMQMNSIEL